MERRYKKRGEKFAITAWRSTSLQVIAGIGFLFLTMVEHDNYANGLLTTTWPQRSNDAWNMLARPGWAMCLSLLAVSLMYGPRKGFINGFLAWELWGPIGKLSFSTYIIHFPLFNLRVMEVSSPEHYTPFQRLELWLGHVGISLFAAVFFWFLVEAPFATLAKMLLDLCQGTRKKRVYKPLEEPLVKSHYER